MTTYQGSVNKLFEDYVYDSFLYYELDSPDIPDYVFDMRCNTLAKHWDLVTHPDKHLATLDALQSGTGYQMVGKWPEWVKQRARQAGKQHWSLEKSEMLEIPPSGYYTGVGSRETPEEVLDLIRSLGKKFCDRGWRGRSGCAPGADTAWWEGAKMSARYEEVGFDNYLPNEWMFKKPQYGAIVPDPEKHIFNVKTFPPDIYEKAKQLAFEARGSFEGLKTGGIELHIRNAFQVLGHNLDTASRAVVLWAEPRGRNAVHGGTNTAYQIAKRFGIEVINLYHPADRRRVETFLSQ